MVMKKEEDLWMSWIVKEMIKSGPDEENDSNCWGMRFCWEMCLLILKLVF
jgi:hypothetical protein